MYISETVLSVAVQLSGLDGFPNRISPAVCKTYTWDVHGVILLHKTNMNYFCVHFFRVIFITIIWLAITVLFRKVSFQNKEIL